MWLEPRRGSVSARSPAGWERAQEDNHRRERTLSIHSIVTTRREAFYWLAILFTFALGTAAGDLMAEVLGLGYLSTGLIVAGVITATAVACRLGLGATTTSIVFVIAIVAAVIYLAVTKADVITVADAPDTGPRRGGVRQTVIVPGLLLVCATVGYQWRTGQDRVDHHRQKDRHGATRTPRDKPAPCQREDRAHHSAGRAAMTGTSNPRRGDPRCLDRARSD
jgi:hypothetical protein